MSKHDEGRRAFLVALGAGAAATTALVPDALAKSNHQHHAATNAPAAERMAEHMPDHGMAGMGGRHGAFFNDDDSRTIAAFTERLMPGAPGKPGATDADVLNYIDLALAGPYADDQYFYRCGVAQLDAHCTQTYGKPFRSLTAAQQDETIAALEQGKAPAFVWPTRASLLQRRAQAHHGRPVRRPDLRRQQGLCRLAPGRLSRRTAGIHAGGHAEQRSVHARTDHRPAGAGQERERAKPWRSKKPMW